MLTPFKEHMQDITKESLLQVARYTDIQPTELQHTLEKAVYPDQKDWKKLLRYSLLALGIGFTVSGLVFFFAYNWADLPKAAKLASVQILLVALSLASLSPRLKPLSRNILLTGAAVLVGLLFAVFGQIYQTGANAYDFFLAWTLFICIWTLVARFAPLTLGFIILLNTSIILYQQQVAKDWSFVSLCMLLFVFNGLIAAATYWLNSRSTTVKTASWFTHILVLASTTFATLGMVWLIMEHESSRLSYLLPILYLGATAITLNYAFKSKQTFHIAVLALSFIISGCALFLRQIDNGDGVFLFLTLFIILTVSLTIKGLLSLQKKWRNDA